jgi:uncharacterized damage-inducible protein DinB
MNDSLRDLFDHHIWATRTLLDACRPLSAEQLTSPGSASFGSILETLNHFVGSDGNYMRQLGGDPPEWPFGDAHAGIDALADHVAKTALAWDVLLSSGEFDAQRELVLPEDEGVYRTHAGIVLAQVFVHGTLHREQVCSMLTALGIEPPDLQSWAYADTTGLGTFAAE